MRALVCGSALIAAATVAPLPPSGTTLVVQVGDAASGAFLADAQVRVPSVGRISRTKWNGEASFGGLASGKYRVQVRAIGYAPGDVDMLVSGDTANVMFNLEHLPAGLDTVRVIADKLPRGLREFEQRRKSNI